MSNHVARRERTSIAIRSSAMTRTTRAGHAGPLIWTTAEGEKIPITAMRTSHLFNAMKMTFNHIAAVWGGEPVWFQHEYSDFTTGAITGPERLAKIVVAMLAELSQRTDLPAHYVDPLAAICRQVLGINTNTKGIEGNHR